MAVVLSKTRVISILLLIFEVVAAFALRTSTTRVLTQQGYVRGIRQDIQTTDRRTKTIYKFLGVPYAKAPIGDLRFKPPQAPPNRNSSDYDATFLRPICVQDDFYFDSIRGAWPGFDPTRDMSEDCLTLNIYTPSTTGTRKYPVIVHIHGGSYVSGSPTRDISPGEYLPTRDVVLVTIQYRLAAFGFFTTGDSEAGGNNGLLDQVEALKWVQQNIEGFGGDNNSVTLLGESAGGFSVGLHYLSPLSRGLFHRGIAVSGVELSPLAYELKSTVLEASNRLLENVNCKKRNSLESVQCLQSLPSDTILQNSMPVLMRLQPFIDHHFLPDKPHTLRERGTFRTFPLISGFVSEEGSHIVNVDIVNPTNERSFESYLESFFENNSRIRLQVHQARAAFDAVKSLYTPTIKNANEYRKNRVDMWSDYVITAPTHAALTFHSDHGAPTYMFEFAHRSKHHEKPKWMGVVHEDPTAYTFGRPLLRCNPSKMTFDDNDRSISDMVVTMFTNFAKFGRPTPTLVSGVQWTQFNASNKAYLEIQSNPAMKRNYHPQRMNFWNFRLPKLLPKDNSQPSRGESDPSPGRW